MRMVQIAVPAVMVAQAAAALEKATSPEDVLAGFRKRADAVIRAEAGKPLRRAKKNPPLGKGRGPYVRGYSYSIVAFAARCLYLNEMLDEANAALVENAQYYGHMGGGGSRIKGNNAYRQGRNHGNAVLAWLYFEIGKQPTLNGHDVAALFSDYRPPAVVVDIARDTEGRGRYEIRQRVQGLGKQGHTFPHMDRPETHDQRSAGRLRAEEGLRQSIP